MGTDLAYRRSPIRIKCLETAEVESGSLSRKSISSDILLELFYAKSAKQTVWRVRFGAQGNDIRFTVQNTINSSLRATNLSISFISLGADYSQLLSEEFRFESQIRYQHPILGTNNGGPLKIKSNMFFDGSSGVIKNFSEIFCVGVFWKGQLQRFRFLHSPSENLASSGKVALFFSTLEIKLGLEF